MRKKRTIVGIFSIAEPEWKKFKSMMVDSDSNFSTWLEWRRSKDELKAHLQSEGVEVVEILVQLDDFREWCAKNEKPLDGASRVEFARLKLQSEHQAGAGPQAASYPA